MGDLFDVDFDLDEEDVEEIEKIVLENPSEVDTDEDNVRNLKDCNPFDATEQDQGKVERDRFLPPQPDEYEETESVQPGLTGYGYRKANGRYEVIAVLEDGSQGTVVATSSESLATKRAENFAKEDNASYLGYITPRR